MHAESAPSRISAMTPSQEVGTMRTHRQSRDKQIQKVPTFAEAYNVYLAVRMAMTVSHAKIVQPYVAACG
jgi:hypothetical protein